MRKYSRWKVLVVALAAILATYLTQPTLAYYSTVGRATNVVTSGNLQLIIHETTDQGTPFPEEGVYVIPGDVVSKVVTVENACDHPFYLRVKAVFGGSDQELSAEQCLALNINTDHWVYHDGWYYYNQVVEPGATTPWFFSQVEVVGSQVDTSFIGKTLQLTVVAQAVQSENNPVQNGDTTTALGWPAE